MAKVEIKLKVDKEIKGKEYKAGTVLMSGDVAKSFEAYDVDKAIQMGQATCRVVEDKKDKKAEAKADDKKE